MRVWKILRPAEERSFFGAESWGGSADDRRDGFVHLSTEAQIDGTLDRHFGQEDEVHLVAFEAESLPALRWEPSRGGQEFPHHYAPLRRVDAVDRRVARRGPQGWERA